MGLLAASLLIISSVECPAPAAVEQKLQALRAPGAVAPRYRLEVGRSGDAVLLTARDEFGALRVQRELPASAPCSELEDAAAVVLLAWEVQLEPAEVPVPLVEAPPPLPEPVAAPLSLDVRASALAQAWVSAGSPTWGAAGSVELHGKRFGLELGVGGQGKRDLALGTGRATWSRFTVSLGPSAAFNLADRVDVTLGASFAMGPFWVTSSGFDKTKPVADFDVGILAQVKVLLPGFWRLRPFIGIGGAWWLRRHVVESTLPDAAKLIPALEASPAIGLAYSP